MIYNEQNEALLQASTLEDKLEHSNTMPKNIVRLEKLFDLQDKFRRLTNTNTSISSLLYEVINIGTEENPKNVNLGKNCTHTKRASFIKVFKEFKDVFAWTYEDLKT